MVWLGDFGRAVAAPAKYQPTAHTFSGSSSHTLQVVEEGEGGDVAGDVSGGRGLQNMEGVAAVLGLWFGGFATRVQGRSFKARCFAMTCYHSKQLWL